MPTIFYQVVIDTGGDSNMSIVELKHDSFHETFNLAQIRQKEINDKSEADLDKSDSDDFPYPVAHILTFDIDGTVLRPSSEDDDSTYSTQNIVS